MKIIGIIPARMGSSRFFGKPLAKIHGIPMIGHVYFRSKLSKALEQVYVATCDKEIFDYVKSIGAEPIMTADTHKRASDRTAEAMLKIEEKIGKKLDIVVMIQGDEPMIYPEMIDLAVGPLIKDDTIQVVNLMSALMDIKEQADPNIIKVVVDTSNFALYFSRQPIPTRREDQIQAPILKQVCIIPFRRDFLIKFNNLKSTPLEITESIDMLRVLEHGYKVKMVISDYKTYSVDTIDDLRRAEVFLKQDKLVNTYKEK